MFFTATIVSAFLAASTGASDILQVDQTFGSPAIRISGSRETGPAAELFSLLEQAQSREGFHRTAEASLTAIADGNYLHIGMRLTSLEEVLSISAGLQGESSWAVMFHGAAAHDLLTALSPEGAELGDDSIAKSTSGMISCYVPGSHIPTCIVKNF